VSSRRHVTTTRYELTGPDGTFVVEAVRTQDGIQVTLGESTYRLKLKQAAAPGDLVAEIADKPVHVTLRGADAQSVEMSIEGERLSFRLPVAVSASVPKLPAQSPPSDVMLAPMPGRVISLMARRGDDVERGDPLVVIESMKMETAIRSDRKGRVEDILVDEGSTVKRGQALLKFRT
jgi:3-methylcrotonyl-CoA carboxylase alpha subunit